MLPEGRRISISYQPPPPVLLVVVVGSVPSLLSLERILDCDFSWFAADDRLSTCPLDLCRERSDFDGLTPLVDSSLPAKTKIKFQVDFQPAGWSWSHPSDSGKL